MANSNMIFPPVGIKNITSAIAESSLCDNDSFGYSGIWIFSGSQGSGKTLLMMHCVRQMLKEYPKANLISNISIFGLPCIPYTGIEDFDRYQNGIYGSIFIIDEIHTLFNSLESKNMPVSSMTVWAQNRKNRRVILGTSQRFTRVAKGIREQCTFNYECQKIVHPFYRYRAIDGEDYDDNGRLLESEKSLFSHNDNKYHLYIPNVSVMRMYNTFEVVKKENLT